MVATRAAQNWLSERYLPRTRLDPGVGNSIRTIIGYIGLVARAADQRRAARRSTCSSSRSIAGALSVGIGFGLQGIVNNFVSGLILLWERGIRVGDWVVVGAEQGFVRKINARATEIETFDRATLIVPNLDAGDRRGQELDARRSHRAASSSGSTSTSKPTRKRCANC